MAEPSKKGQQPDPSKKKGEPPEGTPPAEGEAPPPAEEAAAPEVLRMAEDLFDRADQATVRGNLDYAIHLYLDGLRNNLRDVERGHRGLRDAALRRRQQGKGAGLTTVISQAKAAVFQMLGRHKDSMLALEDAFAHDPQNVMLLMQIMNVARKLQYDGVSLWFGELAAEETLRTKKPQKGIFTNLADLYEAQGRYKDAVNALEQAKKIDPTDRELDRRARNLAAEGTIDESNLENVKDFRQSLLDQGKAQASATQQVVRTKEQLDTQYEELKADLEADPKNAVKMQMLADCQQRRGFTDEAKSLLQKALALSGEYRYKARMDDFRMADYRQNLRDIDESLAKNSDQPDLKAQRKALIAERDVFELEVFLEREKQYPTDMTIRYDLGIRQYRLGQYDAAIVSFQNARRDPKRNIESLHMLGRCFYAKELYGEAQNQFETAIQQYDLTGSPLAKELRYYLAMTFEAEGKVPEAIEWYSAIVQQDYQYRDAAKRLEALRRKATGKS